MSRINKSHKKQVLVRIRTIDGSGKDVIVDRKCSGKAIWEGFVAKFKLTEEDFFGLQFDAVAGKGVKFKSQGGSYALGRRTQQWLSLSDPAESQLGSPSPASSSDSPLPRWELEFRVRFYVGMVLVDQWSEYGRFLFYLQLRDDVFSNRIKMENEQIIFMAGLASQTHFGNWEKDKVPIADYLNQIDKLELRIGEFGGKVESLHVQHRDLSSVKAQGYYMDVVASSPMYGVEWYSCYNDTGEACKLGVSPHGVTVCMKSFEQLDLPWRSIKNISHSKKKFLLIRRNDYSADVTNVFMFDTKPECKAMWIAALQQHTFYRRSEFDKKMKIKNAAQPPNPLPIVAQIPSPRSIKAKGSIRRYTEEPASNIAIKSPPHHAKQLGTTKSAAFAVTLTVLEDEQLGFSVSGGVDAEPVGLPIFVDEMLVDGVAYRDGRISVGDHILSIAGVRLENISHNQAVSVIEQAVQEHTELVFTVFRPHPHDHLHTDEDLQPNDVITSAHHRNHVQHPSQRQSQYSVDLSTPDQTPNQSLRLDGGACFTLIGGADSGCGLFISSVQIPEQDIRAGDELLAINGISTEGMTVAEAFELIHEADTQGELQLEVAENEAGFTMVAEELSDPRRTPQRSGTSQLVGVLTPINAVKSQRRPSGSARTSLQTSSLTSTQVNTKSVTVAGILPTPFYARTTFDFDGSKAFESGISFRATDVIEVLEMLDDTAWIGHHTGTGKVGEMPSIAHATRYIDQNRSSEAILHNVSTTTKPYEIVHKQRLDQLLGNPKASRPVAIYGDTDDLMEHMQPISDSYGLDIHHATFHTTRPPKEGEVDGVDYHFISDADMKYGLARKLFLEAGTYNEHYYGLSFASVVNASREGKTTVLHTARIKAIGRLLNATGLRPVAIFVEPKGEMSEEQRQFRETYRQSFTHIIKTNGDRASTASTVLELIKRSVRKPYWLRPGQPLCKTEEDCPNTLAFHTDCCIDAVPPSTTTAVSTSASSFTLPTQTTTTTAATTTTTAADLATLQAIEQPQHPVFQRQQHDGDRDEQHHQDQELDQDNDKRFDSGSDTESDSASASDGNENTDEDTTEGEDEHDDGDGGDDGDDNVTTSRKWVAPITTRPRRENEVDGKQYHFLSKKRFEKMITKDELIEWGTFHDEYYGVARPTANQKPKPLLRSRTLATALMSSNRVSAANMIGVQNPTSSSMEAQEMMGQKKLDTRRHSEGNPGVTPAAPQWLEESMVERSQIQVDGEDHQHQHIDQAHASSSPTHMHTHKGTITGTGAGTRTLSVATSASSVGGRDSIVELDPRSLLNETTLVRNSSGSFGFTITGGVDFGDLPSISRVHNVSTVEATVRNLCAGDYILAINGVCLAKATHDDTIRLLLESSEVLSLLLVSGNVLNTNTNSSETQSNGSPPRASSTYLLGCRLVRTRMNAGMGFGIEIEPAAEGCGAIVSKVIRGSVAEREYLSVGMCLLTFNGQDISGKSTEGIKSRFSHERGDITLIARGTIANMGRSVKESKSPSTVLGNTEISDVQLRKVKLQKGPKGFGLRLGVDTSGITRVIKVTEGSPADGVVWSDDLIYSINGKSAAGRHRKEALNQLVVRDEVALEILSLKADQNETPMVDLNDSAFLEVEIVLDKDGLGIEIASLPDSGIFVQRVVAGGAAARDGRVYEGDVILEVNGVALYDKSQPADYFTKCFQGKQKMRMKLMRGESLTRTLTITRTTNQSLGMKIVLSSIVTVASVVPDGLVHRAGISAGNQLLMVNNVSLHDKSFKEIRALLSVTPQLILEIVAST